MDALERAGIKIVFGKHRATKLEKRVDEALAATVRDARARMRLAGVALPVMATKKLRTSSATRQANRVTPSISTAY